MIPGEFTFDEKCLKARGSYKLIVKERYDIEVYLEGPCARVISEVQ